MTINLDSTPPRFRRVRGTRIVGCSAWGRLASGFWVVLVDQTRGARYKDLAQFLGAPDAHARIQKLWPESTDFSAWQRSMLHLLASWRSMYDKPPNGTDTKNRVLQSSQRRGTEGMVQHWAQTAVVTAKGRRQIEGDASRDGSLEPKGGEMKQGAVVAAVCETGEAVCGMLATQSVAACNPSRYGHPVAKELRGLLSKRGWERAFNNVDEDSSAYRTFRQFFARHVKARHAADCQPLRRQHHRLARRQHPSRLVADQPGLGDLRAGDGAAPPRQGTSLVDRTAVRRGNMHRSLLWRVLGPPLPGQLRLLPLARPGRRQDRQGTVDPSAGLPRRARGGRRGEGRQGHLGE